MKWDKKAYKNIEKEFFETDEENKITYLRLQFESPKDIFDTNAITKIPVINDEFTDWLHAAIRHAPKKSNIHLDVEFDDMCGYTDEELRNILDKNIMLIDKVGHNSAIRRGWMAGLFLLVGLVFLLGVILVSSLMRDDDAIKTILLSIFEISSWVPIWTSIEILVIDNLELRHRALVYAKRLNRVSFRQKSTIG